MDEKRLAAALDAVENLKENRGCPRKRRESS